MENSSGAEMPWYRVPLLWLGLIILLASLAGSVHLIVVSQAYQTPGDVTGESQSFRGVPLTREQQRSEESTEERPR
jgi:hypothetical protein